MHKEFWQERYSEPGLAYGAEVNEFLQQHGQHLASDRKVLVVGDGEGRNGVWLAQQGMRVTTVDFAQAGVDKALALADERGVEIDAICADLNEWSWPSDEYDAVVSIYLHFPSDIRPWMHQQMLTSLKPGGRIILEAFNKRQLAYPSGGPPVEDALFSADLLAQDFAAANIELCQECVISLNEGKYHVGPGAVVRLLASRS